MAEFALPAPSLAPGNWQVLKGVIADLLVVFLSIALVHVPICCRWLGWRIPRLDSVALWSDIRGSDLGLALIYGTLITLLGYSEYVLVDATDSYAGHQLKQIVKSVAWATLLVYAGIRFSGFGTVTLGMLISSAILNVAGMHCWREWRCRISRRAAGQNAKNVLIVGAGTLGRQIAEDLGKWQHSRVVKGFLDQALSEARVLGPVENLAEVARAEFIDEVIVAFPHDPERAQAAIVEALRNHLDVTVVPDLYGYAASSSKVEHLGGVPLIPLHEEPIPEFGLAIKRAFDLLASLVLLPFLVPLLVAIALLIKMDSPGPVLYKGKRAGKKGREFLCFKFRTMREDADDSKERLRSQNQREGPIFKIADDPRITRWGRFLRRYSLDELPQIWNVLKGEMSLVGPRPHPLDDYQRYELEHLRRLDVMPGLTGLWQISARKDPSFQRNMSLDLEYIENWSVWMDLWILFKTTGVVLGGTGV